MAATEREAQFAEDSDAIPDDAAERKDDDESDAGSEAEEAAGELTDADAIGVDGDAADEAEAEADAAAAAVSAAAAAAPAEPLEPVTGAARVGESLLTLDTVKARTIERVTEVRLEAEQVEAERRREEEERRQDRLWRLHEEADKSGKANAAIEMHWEDLNDYNMPQELFREMQAQRRACETVISSKDALVREFQAELRAKDEEYVKALQQQREGVDTLVDRMDSQCKELQSQYEAELAAIERAFEQERAEQVRAQREEADAILRQRADAEARYTRERLEAEARFAEELDRSQASNAEDYVRLKMKLETDAQTLQQQLAVMRAVYLLNTEKLEYNFRVLTEQSQDNDAATATHRAKVKRLEAALAKVAHEYAQSDRRHRSRNAALTTEFARVTRQFQDLQGKAGQFAAADRARFEQVWGLHDDEAASLTERLLAADRVIQEQILGWRWSAPTSRPSRPPPPRIGGDTLGGEDDVGATGGAEGAEGQDSAGATGGRRRVRGPSDLPAAVHDACALLGCGDEDLDEAAAAQAQAIRQHEQSAHAAAEGGDEADADALAAEEEAVQGVVRLERERRRRARLRLALGAVVSEAGFLLASGPGSGAAGGSGRGGSGGGGGLAAGASKETAAGLILWHLGVRTEADLTDLLHVLVGPESVGEGVGDDVSDAGSEGAGEDGGLVAASAAAAAAAAQMAASTHSESVGGPGADGASSEVGGAMAGLAISADEVVPTLRRWAADKRAMAAAAGSAEEDEVASVAGGGGTRGGDGSSVAGGMMSSLAVTSTVAGAAAAASAAASTGTDSLTTAEAAYWKAVAEAVPSSTIRVWSALERGLQRYLATLRGRAGLLDDIDGLREQNEQLRATLAGYLRADVNRELAFPPAATSRLTGGP